ncbi:MAG TPA: hypothetical protein VK712_00540 [Verrucomicrobiae bacterium]|jgi:hypothetical protein|nr:hypothetical protein [Verrucomicrobiae bacterium]
MRAITEAPLLSREAIKKPLAYEHKVDAAIFLRGLRQESTDTQRRAAAYYLQERTAQITGNIALTGTEVAEKVDEMIEDVQNIGFLRSLVSDYQTATKPRNTFAAAWQSYKPDMSKQPRVRQVLTRAVIFSPVAFAVDVEGLWGLMPQSFTQHNIGGLIGGSLLAGYLVARRDRHYEIHQQENSASELIKPSGQQITAPAA